MIRYLFPLIISLVLFVFLYKGLSLDPRKLDSVKINQPAPAFTLPQVSRPDQTFDHETLKGKVSLLNVWASWCVGCRDEHALLMELARQKTVNLYGLNWKDNLDDAQNWLAKYGDPYLAVGFDNSGRTGIDYGVTATPETFVIDKEGIIRYKHIGPITVHDFESKIWPILEELYKS